jgi:hypothetical protein
MGELCLVLANVVPLHHTNRKGNLQLYNLSNKKSDFDHKAKADIHV